VVLDDLSTGSVDNLASVSVTFHRGSVLDATTLAIAMTGVECVVHLGALPSVPRSIDNPRRTHDANATGTLQVLEAARLSGIHVILASSSSVYGASAQMPKIESMPTRPMSPYAASKLAAEAYAIAYAYSYELPILAFRFFNVYGPLQPASHDYAAVIPSFIEAGLAGRPLIVFGDGEQTRDFTCVETVVSVLTQAVERGVTSLEPVNLAFGTNTSINQLISNLSTMTGLELEVQHEPPRTGDVRASSARPDRLTELFPGIVPVPLERGLRQTVDWFLGASG
jgi:UDP-glucose 4-epimerase